MIRSETWDQRSDTKSKRSDDEGFSTEEQEEHDFDQGQREAPYRGMKYPVTISQEEIFRSSSSSLEEESDEKRSRISNTKLFFNHQAFAVQGPVNVTCLQQCMNRIISLYRVLRTHFYRNELIVDADVEGFIKDCGYTVTDEQNQHTMKDWCTQNIIEVLITDSELLNDITYLSKKVKSYLQEQISNQLVKLLVFTPGEFNENNSSIQLQDYKEVIVLIISSSLADQVSIVWLVKELFDMYFECMHGLLSAKMTKEYDNAEIEQFCFTQLNVVQCKEKGYDFIDYAVYQEKLRKKELKEQLSYWRSHCYDVTQSFINLSERSQLEKKADQWRLQLGHSKRQLKSIVSSKATMEMELETLIQQRMNLEPKENNSKLYTYYDDVTGSITQVSEDAKIILTKAVLGFDVESDNVEKLLLKHDFSEKVLNNFRHMSLDVFSSLSRFQVSDIDIDDTEAKKVLALSEYVRNRIQECISEQAKIKYGLERKIASTRRSLDKNNRLLKEVRHTVESLETQIMKTEYTIHPPVIEELVPELTLTNQRDVTVSQEIRIDANYESMYEYVPFQLDQNVIESLRQYCKECRNEYLRRRKAFGHSGKNNESEDEIWYEDDTKILSKGMEALLLTVYCVILRHISGIDKFTLGVVIDMRFSSNHEKKAIVGPITEVLPLKIDLSEPDLSFKKLFLTLFRTIIEAHGNASTCTLLSINRITKQSLDLPVRFRFVCEKEVEFWRSQGLEVRELLPKDPTLIYPEVFDPHSTNPYKKAYFDKLWSIGEYESVNLKLVLVEADGQIKGGMYFRKDRFDIERVVRWTHRFSDLLEAIQYDQQSPTVASLISRFYHSVWKSRSDIFTQSYSDNLYKIAAEKQSVSLVSLHN
jgi:hypothetical protein